MQGAGGRSSAIHHNTLVWLAPGTPITDSTKPVWCTTLKCPHLSGSQQVRTWTKCLA
jgi:hypothetical protein